MTKARAAIATVRYSMRRPYTAARRNGLFTASTAVRRAQAAAIPASRSLNARPLELGVVRDPDGYRTELIERH